MSNYKEMSGCPDDIVALNTLTIAELEARFLALTLSPPPRPMGRALLILAVAYETLQASHRRRIDARDFRGATRKESIASGGTDLSPDVIVDNDEMSAAHVTR